MACGYISILTDSYIRSYVGIDVSFIHSNSLIDKRHHWDESPSSYMYTDELVNGRLNVSNLARPHLGEWHCRLIGIQHSINISDCMLFLL